MLVELLDDGVTSDWSKIVSYLMRLCTAREDAPQVSQHTFLAGVRWAMFRGFFFNRTV